MKKFHILFLLFVLFTQAAFATKVQIRGGNDKYVWGGNYSFQFIVRPEATAGKLFFYGFPTDNGAWSYVGYEINHKTHQLWSLGYNQYRHRAVDTQLENVLAVGNSQWIGKDKHDPFKDDSGQPYVLQRNKVYTVKVQAKDHMHTATLFMDGRKVATNVHDAGMRYVGKRPYGAKTVLNEVYAVKKDDSCGELKERGYLQQEKEQRGNEDSASNASGKTELMTAIEEGLDKAIGPIMDKTIDLEAKDSEGNTALVYAVRRGKNKLVSELLKRGVEIDTVNDNGQTPLHFAAARDDEALCKFLIRKGCKKQAQDNEGRKPYEYAKSKALKEFLIIP